ncbi:MAG TPA: nitrate/nitrite transporter [Blastocatellia bacterium]|nr:nitrate/nitrite transporter [Blastocatellia bacterium]
MQQTPFIESRAQKILIAMLGAGVLGFIAGFITDDARLWPSFLLNSFYFLTLALGAIVFVSIQHVSNAGWSAAIRRVPEAMMTYLPVGAVLMLAIFFGRHSIYEWSHGIAVTSEAMKAKATFLNTPFFFARMAVVLALWVVFARLLWRESRAQDRDGKLEHTDRSKKISAAFLAVFAITFSLASFDWLMSLEPEFYSTIYAFYCFAGLFLSGVAAITLAIIFLRRHGFLNQVNEDHLHNMGKLLFGFSTFWAYIWLSQYLLIYYANLPEETVFYLKQTATPGWRALFLANLFLNWVIPFLMLISRKAKRNESWLMTACIIVLAGHWLDLYLMILPTSGASWMIGVVDVALVLGFASLFIQTVLAALRQVPLVPTHDPYLVESLALHSFETPEQRFGIDKRSNRQLALATIAFAISFSVWGLIGALAPRFREMYGLTAFQTSLLIAVPVLLGSIGRIPMGILADKFGGRIVFGFLLLFCLIPALGASFTASYGLLVAWGFLIGVAGTSFSVGVAFVSKWFPAKQQGTALGIYGVGNIGQSIAVFGAPAIVAATSDWRVPFWAFGAAAAIFGIIFLLAARNADVKVEPKKFREYLSILKRERLAWALSLFYFLTFGGFVALSIYLPTLLKDIFSLTPTDAGARVAGFVIIATAMRPIGGWLADRYGGASVLMPVLGSISIFALGMTSNAIFIFTIGALGTASLLGLGNGAVFKLVPEYFPRETGTVTGLVGAAGGLGGFFPPLVLGLIKGQTGSYALGFIFLSGFALICLATNYFVFLRREGEEREAAI